MFKDQRKVSGAQGRLPGSSKEAGASVLQMQELDFANSLHEPGATSKEYSCVYTWFWPRESLSKRSR